MTNQVQARVAKQTVTSTAWTYVSFLLSKGVNLLTTVVLARLLTQADFGIVGFALTAMSFLDAVRDLGMGTALIQRRDNIDEASQSAFWLNLASNGGIWLLTVAISPLVAAFFHEPLVVIILPVVSFSFVISSFGGVHDALLKRDMKFGRRIVPSLGESTVKFVVSITLALVGGGVWALVIGQLAGRTAFTIIAWQIVPWRPHRQFSRQISGELVRYGYKVSIDSFLSALQANIDYVFVGRFLGSVSLGIYTVAYRVPEMIIINMCLVVAEVLLPAYSMLQHDLAQLRQAMLATLRYVSLVTIPVGIGLALTAMPLTRVLFGAKWADAGPTMAVLCLYGVVLTISWNIGDVYKAMGRPDILWKTTLVEFGLLAPTLYILAQQSVFHVALGHLSVAIAVSTLRLIIATRRLNVKFFDLISQFLPSLAGSGLMGIGVWVILSLTAQSADVVKLTATIAVGVVIYVISLWWFERDLLVSVSKTVRRFLGREPDSDTNLVLPPENNYVLNEQPTRKIP